MRPPLNYESRPAEPRREQAVRQIFQRIMLGAWCIWLPVFLFAIANSGDRNSLQWPTAFVAGISTIAAVLLTVGYWLVVVPIVWFHERQARAARSAAGR